MVTPTRRLDGRPIAELLHAETRQRIEAAPNAARRPVLASVHRPVDGPFEVYRRRQAKIAESLGVQFRDESLAPNDTAKELAERVRQLAADPGVHAVLVEHPLPAEFSFPAAVDQLPLEKDVDGVSAHSLGRLATHRALHVPAVARAAVRIARHYGVLAPGEPALVLGRSETVGLPLALLLLERGVDATVTVAHSKSSDLRRALQSARTIYSCVGRAGLLDRSNVPEGATVIDVGLSTGPDPARPGSMRSVGDAAPTLEGWAGALTPVPGGVGPVTVAELMHSVVAAWGRLERIP
ncbi:MAG: tetrahydrofolate dehydrogenase/cyclohydrolase catalytic domain-containing protein [Thermoplasmata archaeon]